MTATKAPLRIIAFCCHRALSQKFELAPKTRVLFEPTIEIVALPCSSKVDTLAIVKAFASGAGGIFVVGCADGKCHMLGGNERARKIVNYTKRLLDQAGIESSRLEMFQVETSQWQDFNQAALTMIERINALEIS